MPREWTDIDADWDFWQVMACVAAKIQQFYDKKEDRDKNRDKDAKGCMVCRHYAATFVQVCLRTRCPKDGPRKRLHEGNNVSARTERYPRLG